MTLDEALARLGKMECVDEGEPFTSMVSLNEVEILISDIFIELEKPKALAVQVPNEFTNINQDAFNEWMVYKKYKNKGAITKTLNMLNKYDYQTQQDMVDKSIMNEYKGLFEPKGTPKPKVNIDLALENNVFDMIEQKAQQEQGVVDG